MEYFTLSFLLDLTAFPSSGSLLGPKRLSVRETLTYDLCERLIADILETTESLMGTSINELTHPYLELRIYLAGGATAMLSGGAHPEREKNKASGVHQPDHAHGHPDKSRFGGKGRPRRQSTYAKQC